MSEWNSARDCLGKSDTARREVNSPYPVYCNTTGTSINNQRIIMLTLWNRTGVMVTRGLGTIQPMVVLRLEWGVAVSRTTVVDWAWPQLAWAWRPKHCQDRDKTTRSPPALLGVGKLSQPTSATRRGIRAALSGPAAAVGPMLAVLISIHNLGKAY